MHWGNFKAVYLFLFFIFIFIFEIIKNRKTKKLFSEFKYLKNMDNINISYLRWKNFLIIIAIIFFIIALMKPQWGVKEREVNIKGADIIFALDVSNSMLAKDITPSRIERAKRALSKLMDDFSGNFVSLIAFAGESKVIVPLTFDYKYMKYSILALSTDSVDVQGTNFRELLEKTTLIFKKTNKKRFLIILTDGEDNEGNIDEALRMAKEGDIKIYTIGIGTLRGERIPEYDSSGIMIGFKKDKEGNYIFSKINPDVLRNIAESTGGKFYLNTDIFKSLKNVIDDIKYHKTSNSIKVSIVQYKEKYYYFAFLSFLSLFIAFLLPTGRKKTKMKFLVFILISFFLTGFSFIDRGNHHNNKGIKKYKKKEYLNSLREFQKAKDYTIYDRKLDFNIADALFKSGKYDEALNYYKNAINSPDENLKKSTYYNMGNIYYKTKKYREAFDSYKNALKIDPSFEKAKKNLELTIKKLKEKKQNKNSKNNKKNNNRKQDKKDKDNQNQKDKQKQKNNQNQDKQNNKLNNNRRQNRQQNRKQSLEKKLLENLLNNLKKKESQKRKKLKKGKKKRVKSYDKDW